jgi:hypothetical protein
MDGRRLSNYECIQPLIESGDLKSILGKGISAVKGERKQ